MSVIPPLQLAADSLLGAPAATPDVFEHLTEVAVREHDVYLATCIAKHHDCPRTLFEDLAHTGALAVILDSHDLCEAELAELLAGMPPPALRDIVLQLRNNVSITRIIQDYNLLEPLDATTQAFAFALLESGRPSHGLLVRVAMLVLPSARATGDYSCLDNIAHTGLSARTASLHIWGAILEAFARLGVTSTDDSVMEMLRCYELPSTLPLSYMFDARTTQSPQRVAEIVSHTSTESDIQRATFTLLASNPLLVDKAVVAAYSCLPAPSFPGPALRVAAQASPDAALVLLHQFSSDIPFLQYAVLTNRRLHLNHLRELDSFSDFVRAAIVEYSTMPATGANRDLAHACMASGALSDIELLDVVSYAALEIAPIAIQGRLCVALFNELYDSHAVQAFTCLLQDGITGSLRHVIDTANGATTAHL